MSTFDTVQSFNYNTHFDQNLEKYFSGHPRDNRFRRSQDQRVSKATQSRFTQEDLRVPRNDQRCVSGSDDRRISVVHKRQCDRTSEPIKTYKRLRDEIEEGEREVGGIVEARGRFKRQKRDMIDSITINIKITDAKTIDEIVAICRQHLQEFNHINIATALHRIAKKSKTEKATKNQKVYITSLAEQVSLHFESMESRHLANTAWAYATLNIKNEVLFASLAKEAMHKMNGFDPQNIANMAWAYATLNIKNEELFGSLAKEAMHKMKGFNSQSIANTAWAYAILDIKNEGLFASLADEAMHTIKGFNSQAIANTAWAYATLNYKEGGLFASLAKEAMHKMKDFNSQSIANTAWAYATLNIKNGELFASLAKEAMHKMKGFKSQDISNTAWAFATLNIKKEGLFASLAEEATLKMSSFNSQAIANTAWAYATLNYKDEGLFASVAKEARHKIRGFNCQNIANTAWAYATLNIKDESLFASLAKETMHKISSFGSQAIANMAWAYAALNIKNEGLFASLAEKAMHKIREFNSQEIVNTAWAYAVVDILNPEFLKALVYRLDCSQLGQEDLMQLKYVHLHISYEKRTTLSFMPEQLLRSLLFTTSEKPVSSELHRDVSEHLRKLNIKHNNEESISSLLVDITIPEKKVIIEINGPSHYCTNSREPLGATQFKMRLLQAMGWNAITIPYWEWEALKNNGAKNHYLQSKLEISGLH